MASVWTGFEEYERFNEAIAEVLYGEDQGGRPVYLLPDDDALGQILRLAGAPPGTEGAARLVATVRDTLLLDDPDADPFLAHVSRSHRHSSRSDDTPPALALLMVLAQAADAMDAGEGMSANNYYGRLISLLTVPKPRQARLTSSYQRSAELLWGTLNAWLEAWEGERGVPTAYALGFRYVGLPMSQALVRKHDRHRMATVFAAEGLPPGYQMSPADMEQVLEEWMSTTPPTFTGPLRRVWGQAAARERVVGVACLELESWQGSTEGPKATAGSTRGKLRLVAQLKTFPGLSIELNVTVPNPAGDRAAAAELLSAEGDVAVAMVNGGPGSLRLEDVRGIDPSSLLVDELSVRLDGAGVMTRQPRRLVPLRFDDLQQCYVEVERLQLGDPSVLLVAEPLRSKVEAALANAARPGWNSPATVRGLPAGWLLYRDVQVFADPGTGHVDLNPLRPRSAASLSLTGGFVLPGRLRKFSSWAPPEVTAVGAGDEALRIDVFKAGASEPPVYSTSSHQKIAVVQLSRQLLTDGEYTVVLGAEGTTKPIATSLLRLRSGDTPVVDRTGRPSGLVYRPTAGPLWPLSACEPDGSPQVDGARNDLDIPDELVTVSMPPARKRSRPSTQRSSVRLLRVGRGLGDESCMRTGMHRIQLPDARGGPPVSSTMEGECSTCGLVKRYPTRPRKGDRRKRPDLAPLVDVSALPARTTAAEQDFRVAFDALCHLGHGSAADLARVAGQVEGTALFADTFLRALETLGHVDVRRDPLTLRVSEFELTPPTLVPLGGSVWWLVGRAPHALVRALGRAAGRHRGTLNKDLDQGFPRRTITLDESALPLVLDTPELAAAGLTAAPDSGLRLARALPSLTATAAALPRRPLSAASTISRWDVATAAWRPVDSVASVGAYRFTTYTSTYGLRTAHDLAAGTFGAGPPQLVKHVASAWAGDPLPGYHEASHSVVVPLGAELPTLYGRALALCSGHLPSELTGGLLAYRSVPRSVADAVFTRLVVEEAE